MCLAYFPAPHPGHKMRVDGDGWAGMGIYGDNNQQESNWVRFRDKNSDWCLEGLKITIGV